MKRLFKSILFFALTFVMTGCVKFNASMDINENKSMNFNIIYAVDTSYFGDTSLLENEEKNNLLNSGFKVEDYFEGKMKGIRISRKIHNIDFVSSDETTEYILSKILDKDVSSGAIFKVKKSFLKNVYTANLTFDSNDSSLSGDSSEEEKNNVDENLETDIENSNTALEEDTEEDDELGFGEDFMNGMMSSMDLSFNVNLPYAAISNNATEVSNNGRSLKWKLNTSDVASIQFEFELYNLTTIYICLGSIILILGFIIFLIVRKNGKKKSNNQILNDNSNLNEPAIMQDNINNNVMNIEQPVFSDNQNQSSDMNNNQNIN